MNTKPILDALVANPSGNGALIYVDPETSRRFLVQQFQRAGETRFWLTENRPSSQILLRNSTGQAVAIESSRVHELELISGPNGFHAAATAELGEGVVIYHAERTNLLTRYYTSLEGCADEIARSIESNARYDSAKKLVSDQDIVKSLSVPAKNALGIEVSVWDQVRYGISRVFGSDVDPDEMTDRETQQAEFVHKAYEGLFDGCASLTSDEQMRICRFLATNDYNAWVDIHTIQLIPGESINETYSRDWGREDLADYQGEFGSKPKHDRLVETIRRVGGGPRLSDDTQRQQSIAAQVAAGPKVEPAARGPAARH